MSESKFDNRHAFVIERADRSHVPFVISENQLLLLQRALEAFRDDDDATQDALEDLYDGISEEEFREADPDDVLVEQRLEEAEERMLEDVCDLGQKLEALLTHE